MSTVARPAQARSQPAAARDPALFAYILATVSAEMVVAFADLRIGLILHAATLFGLLTQYCIRVGSRGKRSQAGDRRALDALPAVGLVPLLRILSAAMVVKGLSAVHWSVLAGSTLFIAVLLASRASQAAPPGSGVSARRRNQVWIGLSGAPLGVTGFYLFGSSTRPPESLSQLALISAVAILFGAVLEELLFRKFIQGALERTMGRSSVFWSTLLFSSVYLGSQPIVQLPFTLAIGLYFGWCTFRTRSIAGVAIAHALMNLVMFIALPLMYP